MKKRLLICDLDNTLYDWVSFFVASFYALVDDAVEVTRCDREELLDDFKRVHQLHHDSEFPYALLETETVKKCFPGKTRTELVKLLDSSFHAFNSRRKDTLSLYPTVRETLDTLTRENVTVVAHTEANVYAAVGRLKRLEIIDYFKRIYCRERAGFDHPNPESGRTWAEAIGSYRVTELTHHQRKPNVEVLSEICRSEKFSLDDAAYVGDSMARDMLMAREAGVYSIWAKYGVSHNSRDYERLVRVTHWTADDVARERLLAERTKGLSPDLVLDHSFSELLPTILSAAA
jgi:phosphoglycolate phosphatase